MSRIVTTHDIGVRFSRAMHRLRARAIRRDPGLLDAARARVDALCAADEALGCTTGYPFEWREILQRPTDEIARLITRPDADMDRLRSSSPLPSPLTDADARRRLWRKVSRSVRRERAPI